MLNFETVLSVSKCEQDSRKFIHYAQTKIRLNIRIPVPIIAIKIAEHIVASFSI